MISKKNVIMKSKLTPELAELVGIILGDGSISIKQNNKSQTRLKISFNSKDDLEYISFVKNLISNIFSVEPILKFRKNENTADLLIFKKEIISFLLYDVGLQSSPKWNRALIPYKFLMNNIDKLVLRGYFDTDGSLVTTNNNGIIYPRLEMKISPSPMQKQFIEILNKYDFSFGVYNIGKGKVRIQMNGKKQLDKWINLIGFSNSKHYKKIKRFCKPFICYIKQTSYSIMSEFF